MCLLAAVAFAAWQIHVCWKSVGRYVSPCRRAGQLHEAQADDVNVLDVSGCPLAVAGLKPLAADPAGVRPPPGATRHAAFRRRAAGCIEQQARYSVEAETDDVAAYYTDRLAAGGYRLLRDTPPEAGRKVLVFIEGQTRIILALRKAADQAKIVTVVLTVVTDEP
ncbi:MAG: hypothetical protein SVT52_04025 [Planctomycetota bacterium]|nr:hypothetical protein [Planctomycetota bacterium]